MSEITANEIDLAAELRVWASPDCDYHPESKLLTDAADELDRLQARIDHLTAAITTHHTTKHGSDPATARAVLSPPDRALYAAAGVPHAVLGAFAGRDEAG